MALRYYIKKISCVFLIGLIACIGGLISVPVVIPTPFGEPIEPHLSLGQMILGWIFSILGIFCLLGFILSLRYEKDESK
jgi:hypothetical protein